MFVRTIYATGDPEKLDTAVDGIRTEGRKILAEQPGFRGIGVFTDREVGKLVMGSWWESEKARQDSDERLRERRAAIFEPFAATMLIANYEAVAVHRLRQPEAGRAALRLSRVEFDPADADLFAETFTGTVQHRLELLPGLVASSLFLDRARGRGIVNSIFEDRAALAASRSAQAAVRHEGAAKAHVSVYALEELDVVFAELRLD
ncbi:antibiotic biosynthesis monooxygenase [Streptomyces sp. NBC_01537]|uniref:antibiotic biosynthesis monooxygenase n=1 Tax=Streptomyces sp. NBC_01537 TaxID=2903896 RepID=UPI00386EDDF9